MYISSAILSESCIIIIILYYITVVGSVCLCVHIKNLTNRPTNDTTYLTGNEGCEVFSENAPLQS